MENKILDQIEIDVLALRNLAEKVLEQIRVMKDVAPVHNRKRKKADMVARVEELKARILLGRLKPDNIRKSKKKGK
jgi:hypothetical protein